MPVRDKNYLAWIALQPCMITGSESGIVAHHIRLRAGAGKGQKPSDYRAVPLHYLEHAKLHTMGEQSYWDTYKIVPEIIIIRYIVEWMCRNARETEALAALERCLVSLSDHPFKLDIELIAMRAEASVLNGHLNEAKAALESCSQSLYRLS